jgi:hypothetical protein
MNAERIAAQQQMPAIAFEVPTAMRQGFSEEPISTIAI